jgi:hypothetical protein
LEQLPRRRETVKLLLSKLQEEEAISDLANLDSNGASTNDGAFTSNFVGRFQNGNRSYAHQSERSTPYPVPYRGGFHVGRGHQGPRGGARGSRGAYRGPRGGSARQFTLCSYCHLGPHKVQNCRHRINDGAPLPSSANVSLIQQDSCQEPPANYQLDYTYMSSFNVADFEGFGFVADSGASQHMTDKRSILINYKPFEKGAHTVVGIANTRLEVEGKGDVEVVNSKGLTLLFKDCLLVPGLGMNLFSISAATAKGIEATFFQDMVHFYRNNNLEMEGQRFSEKLYYLDVMVKIQQEVSHSAISRSQPISVWHQRLAHINHRTIVDMFKKELVEGLKLENKSAENPCIDCLKGKMHVQAFPTGRTRGKNLGALIHSDVSGPMETMSPGQSRYFVIFKDDYSGWCVVHFIRNKSEVPDLFKNLVTSFKTQYNATVQVLRSDNGGEYTGHEFEEWLTKMGIRHETSAPYTPQQNGVSERANRTIVEAARSMILARNAPKELWAEAVGYAVYILNRTISSIGEVTPYELVHGEKPDVSNLRIFGSPAFVHIPDTRRQKWDSKALEGLFVGCCSTTKAYRIWIGSKRKIVISRNVIIDESSNMTQLEKEEAMLRSDSFTLLSPQDNPNGVMKQTEKEEPRNDPDVALTTADDTSSESNVPEEIITDTPDIQDKPVTPPEDTSVLDQHPQCSGRTPAHTEAFLEWSRNLSKRDTNPDLALGMEALSISNTVERHEPNTLKEAMMSDQSELWKTAVEDEYKSLMDNKTWRLVKRPTDKNVIKSRWVFKIKPGYEGVSERYKARLVAKGFTQVFGTDYRETFAPVLKYDSLRAILAVVAFHDLEITLLDVKTAFLYGKLKETIFMEQPEGFAVEGKEDHVCLLEQCIYGLKQAPRVWNEKFNEFLLKFGLTRSESDSCVYFNRKDDELLIVGIFVDDGFATGTNTALVKSVIDFLSQEFEMRSLPATRFLGLDIHRDRTQRQLFINQPDFVRKILTKFHMDTCRASAIPTDPGTRLSADMSPTTEEEKLDMASVPYREAVGCLLYLSITCRPDIAFAVNQVAKFCQNPGRAHWNAVKRIFAYLAGTEQYGIIFGTQEPKLLVGYTDADYAGDVDSRCSTSGFTFFVHGSLVSWSSRRQKCVSQSTTEAEYVAASDSCKEAVWLKCLLAEIGEIDNQPVEIRCDNQSAIRSIHNPEFHQRTKHIDVRYHFVRKLQEDGIIDAVYVPSKEQKADLFTKPLPKPEFERMRRELGVCEPITSTT